MIKWLKLIIGFCITALFIWILKEKISSKEIHDIFGTISPIFLISALTFLFCDYALRIIRWWWMLKSLDDNIIAKDCIRPFLVSIALNNVMPFRTGDAVRVIYYNTHLNAPRMRLLGTLILERLLDLMALLIFFFIGLTLATNNSVSNAYTNGIFIVTLLAICLILFILISHQKIQHLMEFLIKLMPASFKQKIWVESLRRQINSFMNVLAILKSPNLTITLIAVSILIWFLEGVVFAFVAIALNASVNNAPWFAMSTGTLSTLIPSTPGYVGTFDYFTIQGLLAYQWPESLAAALAVTVHIILWLPLTLVGLSLMVIPTKASKRMQHQMKVQQNE